MITVARSIEPQLLAREKATWTADLLAATTKDERRKAESKYGHKAIKEALIKMFNGKCAYCESKILHVDYGHIEHFRPKSVERFRPLTFEWNNLFLACAVCNGPQYKGDQFPEVAQGGPLVNPCDDVPEDHFEFLFDLASKTATVVHTTVRGKVSVDLLGLNRSELRTHRSKFLEKLFVLSQFARTDPEARRLFDQSRRNEEEYAAFARALPVQL